MSATIFQIQSTLIVILMTIGIWKRHKRTFHVRTMLTAIIWDILLVLQIELTRGAIAKASKVVVNPMILNIHVSLAVSTVLLYFFMIFTGRKVLAGQTDLRKVHRRAGKLTFSLRILTYITSYWAVIS